MLLLIISFLLLFYCVYNFTRKVYNNNIAIPLAYSIVIFSLYIYIQNEVLSIFSGINQKSLLITWLMFDVVIVVISCSTLKECLGEKRRLNFKSIKFNWTIFPIIFFSLFMIILAYNTVPYNSDSINYHLPRVAHWAQNGSVWHFASSSEAQVSAPVFAEYIQLQIYVLSNNTDQFATLVQCFSYLVSGVLIFFVSRTLGAEKKWAFMSVMVFFALPITFGEALNTQVDLITAVYTLTFTLLIVLLYKQEVLLNLDRKCLFHIGCMGLCMGMAFMAKFTIAFIIIPFLLWLFIICVKQKIAKKTLVAYMFTGIAAFFAVYLPEASRLIKTFGTIFTNEVGAGQLVETIKPRFVMVAFLKNFGYNLSGHFVYNSSKYIEGFINRIARVLHVDPDSALISFENNSFYVNEAFAYNHDTANGQIICILFLVSVIVLVTSKLRRKQVKSIDGMGYIIATTVSFVLFLSLMRFTGRRARYEISFFALMCPMVVYIFQQCLSIKKQVIARSVIAFVCFCEILSLSVYHLEYTGMRGVRPFAYFSPKSMYGSYQALVDVVEQEDYKNIGLMNSSPYEYYVWVLMSKDDIRIEHVNVENDTKVHENFDFYPDCILYISNEEEMKNNNYVHGVNYVTINSYTDGILWYGIGIREKENFSHDK